MGSQPVNGDLAVELWDKLMEARVSFPSAGELIVKGGVYISRDQAEHMRSKIAPLVGRLGGDEAREALGEAQQFAALGECFVYLHWVSQATGSPSATFHSYADHYLTSAISLIEDRTGAGSRDAAKKRAQARRQVDTETLHSLLNTYLNMPIHLITETKYPDPSPPSAPPPEPPSLTLQAEPRAAAPSAPAVVKAPAVPHHDAGQDPDADSRAATAPETPPPPKTNEVGVHGRSRGETEGQPRNVQQTAGARGRSGGRRRPHRTGRRVIALGKSILALIGAVIAGAVVAVAVLAAARIRASLSGWYENVFWGGVIGFLIMFLVVQLYPKGGFKVRGVRRSDRRSEEGRLLARAVFVVVSVVVSVTGVARVSANPSSMKLVDSGVTGLTALMSEQFGRMISERSADILSETIICGIVGVVLGIAIGFVFRLILLLLSGESRE